MFGVLSYSFWDNEQNESMHWLLVTFNIYFLIFSKSINVAESSIKRDTDSDSGISIEISSNTTSSMTPIPPPIPILLEPLTTEEQVRSLPNYTLMVQEAIIALGKGEKSNENFRQTKGESDSNLFITYSYWFIQEKIGIENTMQLRF